jgi:hypothetical protein
MYNPKGGVVGKHYLLCPLTIERTYKPVTELAMFCSHFGFLKLNQTCTLERSCAKKLVILSLDWVSIIGSNNSINYLILRPFAFGVFVFCFLFFFCFGKHYILGN